MDGEEECPICPAWCEMNLDDTPSYTKLYLGSVFDDTVWMHKSFEALYCPGPDNICDTSDLESYESRLGINKNQRNIGGIKKYKPEILSFGGPVTDSNRQKSLEERYETFDATDRGIGYIHVKVKDWIMGTNPFAQPPWNCPSSCSTRCGDRNPHNHPYQAARDNRIGHKLRPYMCCQKDLGIEAAIDAVSSVIDDALDDITSSVEDAKEQLKVLVTKVLDFRTKMRELILAGLNALVTKIKSTEMYKTFSKGIRELAASLPSLAISTDQLTQKDLFTWSLITDSTVGSAVLRELSALINLLRNAYQKLAKGVNSILKSIAPSDTNMRIENDVAKLHKIPDSFVQAADCKGVDLGMKLTEGKLVACIADTAHYFCLDTEKDTSGKCPSKTKSQYLQTKLEQGISIPLEYSGTVRMKFSLEGSLMMGLILRIPEGTLTGEKIDVDIVDHVPVGGGGGGDAQAGLVNNKNV